MRDIELANEETKYMITVKVSGDPIQQRINIKVSLLNQSPFFLPPVEVEVFQLDFVNFTVQTGIRDWYPASQSH